MSKPTIAAGFPRAFLDFAVSRGAARRTLFARSQLTPAELAEPNDRVPLTKYLDLLRAGVESSDEPALALLFGESVRLQDISSVGMIGEIVEGWESGREHTNRYARLLLDEDDGADADRVAVKREPGEVWMKFVSAIYVDNPLLTESAFARAVCGVRALLNSKRVSLRAPFPKAIHFTRAEPAQRAEYDRVFGVPLFFHSEVNALVVDEEVMSLTMPRANPNFSKLLTSHADELLEDLERTKTTRGRVERLLVPVLPLGGAKAERIASELGLSRQTLFRRLKREGVTFEQVLDELRYKLALEYLNGKNLPVNRTAYLLGFSEPAAFSRAFKRWTGSSPRTWSNKIRGDQIN